MDGVVAMDPIMRAARSFLDELEERWAEGSARALPLVADASERGDVAQALRLGERAPENRVPAVLLRTTEPVDLSRATARPEQASKGGH